MSGKILTLELLPKMLLANQIAGFLKCNICKKLRDQVDLLFTDKHQSFVQASAIAFGWHGQSCPKYPI